MIARGPAFESRQDPNFLGSHSPPCFGLDTYKANDCVIHQQISDLLVRGEVARSLHLSKSVLCAPIWPCSHHDLTLITYSGASHGIVP